MIDHFYTNLIFLFNNKMILEWDYSKYTLATLKLVSIM